MTPPSDAADALPGSRLPTAVAISGTWKFFLLKPSWQAGHLLHPVGSGSFAGVFHLSYVKMWWNHSSVSYSGSYAAWLGNGLLGYEHWIYHSSRLSSKMQSIQPRKTESHPEGWHGMVTLCFPKEHVEVAFWGCWFCINRERHTRIHCWKHTIIYG